MGEMPRNRDSALLRVSNVPTRRWPLNRGLSAMRRIPEWQVWGQNEAKGLRVVLKGWLPFAIYTRRGSENKALRLAGTTPKCLSNTQALSQEKACQSPQLWLQAVSVPDSEVLKIHPEGRMFCKGVSILHFLRHRAGPLCLLLCCPSLWCLLLAFLTYYHGARCYLKLPDPSCPTKHNHLSACAIAK